MSQCDISTYNCFLILLTLNNFAYIVLSPDNTFCSFGVFPARVSTEKPISYFFPVIWGKQTLGNKKNIAKAKKLNDPNYLKKGSYRQKRNEKPSK